MGRDVTNYIVVDYKNKENLSLIKKYLDDIYNDECLMLYSDGISDTDNFDFLDKSRITILGKNICSIDDRILLCYIESRKCDLLESFKNFIEPYLGSIELAKIFLHDAEDNYDLIEKGIKEKCYKTYFYEDMTEDYNDSFIIGKFILKRCSIGCEVG